MIPPRIHVLPSPDVHPGTGVWKAENNGSAEMAGAMEYAPVSELDRLRDALTFYADLSSEGPWHLPSEDYGKRARTVLQEHQPPTEYEVKLAQLKKDFPNGI